jgi:segregation and condensation protein A
VTTQEPSGVEQPPDERQTYVVHLPLFDGPLDLLLHLIEKRQMEITAISLVEVTDQYLAQLRQWEQQKLLPLANMAAFVSIAANLLYIKSHSLLPQSPHEQSSNDMDRIANMADELQRHLLEYKGAKEIASLLRQREEQGLQTYSRPGLLPGIEAHLDWTPPALVGVDAPGLAKAFQRVLARQEKELVTGQGAELMPVARVRVSERIKEIRQRLSSAPAVLLSSLLERESSRLVVIVTFIAILELWKWERIDIEQESIMGPIILFPGQRWSEAWQELVDD